MRKTSFLTLLLFSLLFLTVVMTAQPAPQVRQVGSLTVNIPTLTIDSVTPYDHGLVIALSYVNFSFISPNQQESSTLYIYYVNSTTKALLYKSILSGISGVFTFTKDGDLYVVVDTFTPPSTPSGVGSYKYESYVYVFSGLRLVNTFTLNGLLAGGKEAQSPLINVSALQLAKISLSSFKNPSTNLTEVSLSSNFTIMLNNANITVTNLLPQMELQLPSGVLLVMENDSDLVTGQPLGQVPQSIPINITLFNNDGKIVWTEEYHFFNGFIPYDLPESTKVSTIITESVATVVGDQLFMVNSTPFAETAFYGQASQYPTTNSTIVGIDLSNGEITSSISLTNTSPYIALQNLGGQLYVSIFGSHEVTVEKYNGNGLTLVGKIPLVTQVKEVTLPGPGSFTMNRTTLLTNFYYNQGEYFLVANPTLGGTNVTDVYAGGITSYVLSGNVTSSDITEDNVILLNESNQFTLAFLNNNGTVRGSVSIGQVGVPSLYSGLSEPDVAITPINPYAYYVVKAYSNLSITNTMSIGVSLPSGETQVTVYEVNFPQPVTATSTMSNTSTAVKTPMSTTPAPPTTSGTPILYIGIIVGIAVIVAVGVVLVLRR
ncbi:hypothetical protein [Stygiolobus caldivivus]|uniref:Uncharacterized protein n=1 Tax=Stygiolobus caldivivus TaxID=2824673 RepID=A0A8D5U3Z4_9CREN|nr:hypothetical protein [Stygiolobus caldivivus]BCU68839.1 hypothetical protein KN1_01360 [Stygiolobus caldivivus]